ncbi:MAG: hypothetical protein OEW48_15805, partial [Phycisphaerae bacterium]|nr:hypothetical protein [Phycisphaerae bacterium]
MYRARKSSLLGKITVLFIICCCLPAWAKYGGGTGEPDDPYLIYTAEQMNAIGADSNDWDKHFKLMADIDLSAFTGTSFNIIGNFGGVFDGNGHKISNFSYTSTDTDSIGLFGHVDDPNAVIKDLGLIAPNVDAGTGRRVGSLLGRLQNGAITGCYVEGGSVAGDRDIGGLVGKSNRGTITDSYSSCSVSGDNDVGGLVGWDDHGTISNCYSSSSVSGVRFAGGLVGWDDHGTISNCYSSSSVSGNYTVGGLVGKSNRGTITNCCSTGSVEGLENVGGLVGSNDSTITNCYSAGSVLGTSNIGGLVGYTYWGTITNCYSTGSISGDWDVGGLLGNNYKGTITNCYSTGDVSGDWGVGGLVGSNRGTITNCYSAGSVLGTSNIGGLVGYNSRGTITNCCSTGSVLGDEHVGGLVGYNYKGIGEVTNSFWDIETSGQVSSDGGTGKTTAEMQTMSTFTDAGWDFVGETFNGIEDIWYIPQQDYPHLWWEGIQVPMKLTPRKLNCRSYGNWVKAHLTLPQGFTVADVNSERPAVLHSFGFQSAPLYVFINKDKVVEIEAAF